MEGRTWILALVGAVLGAAVGLVYAYSLDPFCIGSAGLSLTCYYKSFFAWQVAELVANVLWTALGAVVGGLGSVAILGFMRRSQKLVSP